MSDELEKGLDEIRRLIHNRINQISNYKHELDDRDKLDDEYLKECFSRLFSVMGDFYVHLESMYIMSESSKRQMDLLKDAFLQLRELKNDSMLRQKIVRIFDSYNESAQELDKSFKKTYGIDWDSNK